MAWNPTPEVAVARDAARKLGQADQSIVIWINRETGKLGMASYGETKDLCDQAKLLGDAAYDAVYAKLIEME